MAIYALDDRVPDVHPSAYVHPDAVVIGAVTLAAGASVWPHAVLRGDYGRIEVGEATNIQDGTVVHCTPVDPTIIGARCVLGHNAHVEGAVIEDDTLIASGSVVLNGAHVGAGSVVGAGAVVPFGAVVPDRSMALGVPARVREDFTVPEGHLHVNVDMYAANAEHYRTALRRIG
ncbi:gamma carbonic anhydrase family protein [Tomitella cavernea]|uniref:Gamma carbonic anhydrase family protein n=1 Tax=Tomitella cavernea TaxID=1387982 RepID=A0ABP9CS69_9ACTN|nr:gamma carbonic anhydrase family protein [Tomitella cavernea]